MKVRTEDKRERKEEGREKKRRPRMKKNERKGGKILEEEESTMS